MKQIATVTRMIGTDTAEVIVVRETACGHDCENCGGCGAQGSCISVCARTNFAVEPGDMVELFSDNRVLGFAALVYLLPVVLFFVGYFSFPFFQENLRYLCGGVGFAVGIILAVLQDRRVRRNNALSYQILRKI